MGGDPRGMVFYGFALIDEKGKPVEPWGAAGGSATFLGWEERYLKAKGGAEYDVPANANYLGRDWENWRQESGALIDACSVDVQLAGYDGNLVSCVVIKKTFVEAYWAEIKPLKTLETKPEWDSQLREWCELLGVPYLKPGWFVASLYF